MEGLIGSNLIGREHPAGVLQAEVMRASGSHGGLVLVTGEAGIGKSTLVAGAADEARRQGGLVLNGACWDSDSAPGYWPWTQVIRGLKRTAAASEWPPALAVLLGEAPAVEGSDGFQIYDAVTTALVSASQRQPVVVVLEDLHWADTASLKLLEFAAQHTWFERLLILGTYRDVEVEQPAHPLGPLISPLVAKATTITLTGLGESEVGELMARTSGIEPDAALVAEVHHRTGGNPFFVEQTARLWRSGGSVTAVAPGVRDAVRRRLSLLPSPVVELLTMAAVLGREFHRQVLAACVSMPVPQADRMLDQAVTSRLVTVEGAGMFSFAHDLVRETLYEEAGSPVLHAKVIRELDRAGREPGPAPALEGRLLPADLARHAYLAGSELPAERRAKLLRDAADDALCRMAVDETINHLRRAYEVVEDPVQRVIIGLDLGRTLQHLASTSEEMWQLFETGAALARQTGDPFLLARAAIILGRAEGDSAREMLKKELLEEAYLALIGDVPEGKSRELLAEELTFQIAAQARHGEDDEALAFSLWARHETIWGLGSASERVALCDEMISVARRRHDLDTEQFASSLRWVALLELGDPRYVDQLHAFVALIEREGTPRFAWAGAIDRSIIETFRGDFATAEALLNEALHGDDQFQSGHWYMAEHLRWAMLLPQGRFAELRALQHDLALSGHPYAGVLEGITALQRGDPETARRHRRDGETIPRVFEPLVLRFHAHLAAATGDRELAARTRLALSPHSGQWLLSIYGCDISGPVDLWIGLLEAAEERWDEAIARLTAAHRSADLLGSRTWSVETRAHLAKVLEAAGNTKAAAEMRAQVAAEAAELGMRHLVRAEEASSSEFRRDGTVWTLRYDGHEAHVPDAKGLRDLHTLLRRPGAEFAAVELLDPAAGPELVAAKRMGGDAILDDEAKAAYRRRLEQLDEQIDRAAELGDDARAAAYDAERQALLDELRTAAGLAGRDRRLGDEAERARKTVTARIRDTLRKIDAVHPSLAAHLRESVSTGSTCSYRPSKDVSWLL